ncbi:hypothetical protein FEM48_Zijuj01G0207500 [Ziziphus jujuba var. spinosa]|uniref:Uncharacterized protein n=1 Tax=Ziziphus jujuba var. spinosa TaxID=714518 RepID=A0A978W3G7_ZIZJJ|nr:hypothetical protein FEM48_Zijuj01G0207500 [Ziziphus jujuba var. spinosa]
MPLIYKKQRMLDFREPTCENGHKLILTICRRTNCRSVRMELLMEEEALNLFLEIVGYDVTSVRKIT